MPPLFPGSVLPVKLAYLHARNRAVNEACTYRMKAHSKQLKGSDPLLGQRWPQYSKRARLSAFDDRTAKWFLALGPLTLSW